MNDLPKNELLSAYLDGELTAAERAEVERLLAANPAAQQLLDELRTLSATLQALPQQKLGEDLTERVLRLAERRMLTEGEPGQMEPSFQAPVPLVRSVFRRVVTRRTMVWLGLTLAIAVMITINERWRSLRRAADAGRELARAPERWEGAAGELRPPPSIRARPVDVPEAAKEAKPPVASEPRGDRNTQMGLTNKKEAGSLSERKAGAALTKPDQIELHHDMRGAVVRVKSEESEEADRVLQTLEPGEKRGPKMEPARRAARMPAEAAPAGPSSGIAKGVPKPAEDRPVPRLAEGAGQIQKDSPTVGGFGGAVQTEKSAAEADRRGGRRAEQDEQLAEARDGLLVVHCDISPEAARKQAFDKLLDANGITRHEQRDRSGRADDAEVATLRAKDAPQADEKSAAGAKESANLDKTLQRAGEAGDADLIFAEGTAAQIRATLAGLEAQPDVFLSVSVKPTQDAAGQNAALQDSRERSARSGATNGKASSGGIGGIQAYELFQRSAKPARAKAVPGQDLASPKALPPPAQQGAQQIQVPGADAKGVEKRQRGAAAPAPQPPAAAGLRPMAKAAEGQRPGPAPDRAQQSLQSRQSAQSALRQQVLFVVRVVGGNPTPAAAVKVQAGTEVDAAKPAKPSPSPADRPSQQQ